MKTRNKIIDLLAMIGAGMLLIPQGAIAAGMVKAALNGYAEVPALSTSASGDFQAQIGSGSISYTLSYNGIDSGVLFAHIHLGRPGTNGGVSAFLCSNSPAPTPVPACPSNGGTVSGVIEPGDVIGPAGQGITAGEFDELVEAIMAGATYVNVHSNTFPSGEVRGQIRRGAGP